MEILFIIYSSRKLVFTVGLLIGFVFGILFIKTEIEHSSKVSCPKQKPSDFSYYRKWISRKGFERLPLDYDEYSYGNTSLFSEASFLKDEVSILCAVFVRKVKNAQAIKDTWGKHCNHLVFFGIHPNVNIPVIRFTPKNSFHFLCDSILYIWKHYQDKLNWVLFVPDDIFAIPENLRYYVATLDHKTPLYLGHTLTFWSQLYNVGQAGYAVSKGALEILQSKFNTTESCQSGGKYWKNEDFYLGKHLGEMGVFPEDTRDARGRGRFHGYSLNQLLFPGKLSTLSSYWKKSVFPMKEGIECCSERSVTFHGIEPDKIYMYHYLLNSLFVFRHGGHHGNQPAPTAGPEDVVWREFLRQEGYGNASISSDDFFQLWQNKISAPDQFNARVRQEHLGSAGPSGFANMPLVLESMLSAMRNDSDNEI